MSLLYSLCLCVAYAITSIMFSITAKFLFSIFQFHNTLILLFYEQTINIVLCSLIKVYKEHKQNKQSLKDESVIENVKLILKEDFFQKRKNTFLYSLLYVAQVICGMKALSLINIPMFNTLRRTLVFFVFVIQAMFGESGKLSCNLVISIFMIAMGAVIAGYEHLEDQYFGYGLVILNNILNAISLLIAKQLHKDNKLEPLELVYNNSINIWPILSISIFLSGELREFVSLDVVYNSEFATLFSLLALFGFLNNYTTNVCTMKNSPIAIAITHNVKDIFTTAMSILLFKDLELDSTIILGISISFIGSFIYSISKMAEITKQKEEGDIPNQYITIVQNNSFEGENQENIVGDFVQHDQITE